jgi:hypothetical protein
MDYWYSRDRLGAHRVRRGSRHKGSSDLQAHSAGLGRTAMVDLDMARCLPRFTWNIVRTNRRGPLCGPLVQFNGGFRGICSPYRPTAVRPAKPEIQIKTAGVSPLFASVLVRRTGGGGPPGHLGLAAVFRMDQSVPTARNRCLCVLSSARLPRHLAQQVFL